MPSFTYQSQEGKQMHSTKFLTPKYTLVQAAYWGGYCTLHAYAAVFLLDKGFSNGSIGLLLALANVLAVFLQPLVGGILDKAEKFDVRDAMLFFSVLTIGISLLLYLAGNHMAFIGILFLTSYMLQMVCQPLTSTLGYEFINKGYPLNFGLPRGIGSCSFAAVSMIVGNIIGKKGSGVLPICTIVLFVIYLVAIWMMKIPMESYGAATETDGNRTAASHEEQNETQRNGAAKKGVAHNRFSDFVKHYPKFSVFLLSVVTIFILHSMINDFFIQIITPLGGNSTTLGYAISLAAVVELPAMAAFGMLKKKINGGTLLKWSLILFTVKGLLMLLAQNMAMVYVSQCFQMVAYALFIPASIDYVNQKMEDMDLVKGQAFVTGALTLGSVFGTVFGGFLLDVATPKTMLLIGIVISAIGSIIACLSVEKVVDIR